ncbi:hypothetical protein SDC9_81217 [bioreactor metagenome]|uniref:Uncharacterized protein n=1 Tax=bioreactor metagenome TaxID=1076179 RepID=A0A644Z172_9ZZZZ
MVPAAIRANLNDTHLELTELVLHLRELLVRLDAPGELPELVTENVVQQRQPVGDADWAVASGQCAVMQSRSDEQGIRVTGVETGQQCLWMTHRFEGRPPLQGVAHLLTLGAEALRSHAHKPKPVSQPGRFGRVDAGRQRLVG